MDIQTMLDNAMQAKRAKEMLTSTQLTLGELILKLDAVADKNLPVVFDDGEHTPTGLASWRGSYCELAIQYDGGGGSCFEQPKEDCKLDEFGSHDYKCPCGGTKCHGTTLPPKPTVQDLLAVLKLAQGKFFVGYKGGDFTMGKTTPLWVANYGTSSGFKESEGKYSQGVMEVRLAPNRVEIVTEPLSY